MENKEFGVDELKKIMNKGKFKNLDEYINSMISKLMYDFMINFN